jgi:ABC-type spermidine/putrescine transport system permease subunit II
MGLVASNIGITIGHTIIAMPVVFMIMLATSQTGGPPPRSSTVAPCPRH